MLKKTYLTKEQQIKRSFKKGLIVSFIIVIGVVILYQFYVIPKVKKSEKSKILIGLSKEENQMDIIALNKDINQGELITEDMIKIVTYDKELLPTDTLKGREEIKDKVARMNLKANTIVTNSMLLEREDVLTTDLRKQDFDHILLNVNLQPGNFIDIRYRKKDGSDFVVASKKKILDRNDGIMITNITEKERNYINNSTVSASLTGAVLYTTIYVDPENQPPAKITYEINKNVKEIIEKDPNIIRSSQEELKNRINQENDNDKNKEDIDITKNHNDKSKDEFKPMFIE
ncbi:SAF domain-containing protein [Clostridium sp. UBA2485]|uniref:SAF domain-containing protein n=1 Tax=Clostridium sp. UBA2485 TaxID=1946352 RepID=UPI0025C2D6F7|nr:SAF domain-containing protein [Clostridium sp. UBA2485]